MAPSSLRAFVCSAYPPLLCVKALFFSARRRRAFFFRSMTDARWRQAHASRALLQLGANGAGDAIRLHLPAGPRHLLARHAARSYGAREDAPLGFPGRRQPAPDAARL